MSYCLIRYLTKVSNHLVGEEMVYEHHADRIVLILQKYDAPDEEDKIVSKTAEMEVEQKLGVLEEDLDYASEFKREEKPQEGKPA